MAASPAVASLIKLSSQPVILRGLDYLSPAFVVMLSDSPPEPRPIRASALVGHVLVIGLMVPSIRARSEIQVATGWISDADFTLHPSELAKTLFSIRSGWLLSLCRDEQALPSWAYASALAGPIRGILVAQPDIGMTTRIFITWDFRMFLAGMSLRCVIGLSGLAPVGYYLSYLNLSPFQLRVD